MPNLNLSAWTERSPMPLPRAGCAVAAWNGKLLVAGGTLWNADKKLWSERVDAFDPAADRWDPLPALPAPHGDAACVVLSGTVYILGGGRDGAIAGTAWSFRGRAWEEVPAMVLPAPRKSIAAEVVGDTIYLMGGYEPSSGPAAASRAVWAWTLGAQRWKERAPLPGLPRTNPAVAAIGGKIYAAGGVAHDQGTLTNLDEILVYDPAADRWSAVGKLPFPNRAASGVTVDGKLIVIGGYNTKFEAEVAVFDPATGQTGSAGSIPHALADSRFAVVNQSIFGVGGECGVKMRAPWTLEAKVS
jgi:N-acetylneuraminic acid mutarotase